MPQPLHQMPPEMGERLFAQKSMTGREKPKAEADQSPRSLWPGLGSRFTGDSCQKVQAQAPPSEVPVIGLKLRHL